MKTKTQLQDEALEAIADNSYVGVQIGTGGGKTLLGLKHMIKQYTTTSSFLVVAPRESIFAEWKNEAVNHNCEFLLAHITFSTYISLHKQDLRHDWVYLDECHSLKYKHATWLESYQNSNGKLLGLTGTYPINKSSEKFKMCDMYCRKIFAYTVDEGVDEGMLNDYKIFVHLLQLDSKINVIKKSRSGKTWKTSELKDYHGLTKALDNAPSMKAKQQLAIIRMKALQSYPSKTAYTKHILKHIPYKVIVFANTQEQADQLCKYSYHSKNKSSEKNLELFKSDLIKELACVDQLSEGKTIPNLKSGIIMHSYSNERKAAQKIGRFLRLNPNDKAIIHILCYENSIDLIWVKNALKTFNQSKIKYYKAKWN
jgi:superfamily II DNA or RNA helicase